MPHQLVGEYVLVRLTATTVECLFKGRRVAAHVRCYLSGKHTTLPEHMPSSHRRHMKWTPGRLLNWGQKIGAGTRAVVQWQLENRPHPEQGYRACLGLLNLAKDLRRGAPGGGLPPGADHRRPTPQTDHRDPRGQTRPAPDLFPAADTAAPTASRSHSNVRGADYFRDSTTAPKPLQR